MTDIRSPNTDQFASASNGPVHEARRWSGDGWVAQVLKNEDDDGWAVAMTREGAAEPVLVGPWTMGRDKKNPKPLDVNAFNTLVKTAFEFVRRQEQQLHASLHQSLAVTAQAGRITVSLDIVPDEEHPHALLSAHAADGQLLASVQVSPAFRLNRAGAVGWADSGFARPAGRE